VQGPNGLLTAASLKECKALAAMVSASQTVRGGHCYVRATRERAQVFARRQIPKERRVAEEYLARLARALLTRELRADDLKEPPRLHCRDDAAKVEIMMCPTP
jgi:hypothetical protein